MKGINDTRIVQDKMGNQLRRAREGDRLKRPEFVQRLKESTKAPTESRTEMTVERLKQWEYGNNPIGHEWIPAICEVLNCDVGYLFGEYEERRRELSDVHKITGLSESSIKILEDAEFSSGYEDSTNPDKIRVGVLGVV